MLNPVRPFFYLLLYVAVIYLRPQEYIPELLDVPLVPIMMLLSGLLWLMMQPKTFDAPHYKLILWLTAVMCVSLLLTGWLGGAAFVLNDFIPAILLFYVISTSVDSLDRFRATGLALTAIAVIISLHGADQAAHPDGIGWTGAKMIDGRITYLGILNDPNDLSMALLIALPFSFYLFNTSGSFLAKLAYLASAGTILYGIFLCNSRGAILALLAMMLAASIRRFGWKRSIAFAPVLLGLVLAVGPNRAGDMSADEESAAGRIDAWYEGFAMFRQHPFFGVGKGMFTEYNSLTAHNSFVLAIAELGLVGYFIWLSFFVLAGVMLYRLVTSEEPAPPQEPEAETAVVDPVEATDAPTWSELQRSARSLAYSFIGAMVAAFFLSRSYVIFLYLLVGLVVAIYQLARHHWPGFVAIRFGDFWGRLVAIEVGSIVFLWALTQVLLRLG